MTYTNTLTTLATCQPEYMTQDPIGDKILAHLGTNGQTADWRVLAATTDTAMAFAVDAFWSALDRLEAAKLIVVQNGGNEGDLLTATV